VLLAAGQTAGHINPALTIAAAMTARCPDVRCTFVATADGLERQLIPRAGYSIEIVRAAPVRGGGCVRWCTGAVALPAAFRDAAATIRRISPDAVIGVGGYLSAAIVMTAARVGVPTLIVEPNVLPGLANRCLAPFVDAAAVTWRETAAALGRAQLTGTPIRRALFEIEPPAFRTDRIRILVLGGTQGAPALNRAVAGALPHLMRPRGRFTIAHQTGRGSRSHDAATIVSGDTRVAPFFDDIVSEYAQADLVVTAAGATTCAELAAARRPSILIPLGVAGHHQRANAHAMADAGAAMVIDERALTPDVLAAAIRMLADDPDRRTAMAAAAARLARPFATQMVADLALQLAGVVGAAGPRRVARRTTPFGRTESER
jgi:UDP-N-acetylglucosamine--N-acetylmuramyl-(pentapeptide) pyrophosphoryl-undecaprenol N-acetylglucosamine transferase